MIEFTIDAPHQVPCFYPESLNDWADFDQWMTDRKYFTLGLDAETNAEDPWDPRFLLRLVQISDGVTAWVLNPHSDYRQALANLINQHPRFVAQFSGVAEIPFLGRGLPGSVRLGELVPHIIDYQPMQAVMFPRTLLPQKDGIDARLRWDKGLKPSYAREVSNCLIVAETVMHAKFKAHAPVGHRTPKAATKWGFANIPLLDPDYLAYSAMDAVAVKVLHDQGSSWLSTRDLLREEVEREQVLQWDCDNMVYRGNPVDPPYVEWLANELDQVIITETPFLAKYGIPKSGQGGSIGKAMADLGQAPVKWNKGNKDPATGLMKPDTPCWDKDALNQILALDNEGDPLNEIKTVVASVLAVRRAGKFRTTYVKPMLESFDRDCRIHCNFRSIGTVTHRNSAMNPPLQQQPKKDVRVRAAFGGIPGWVWVTCDLEQGEPRFMAALSGDPKYVAAVQSGDVNNVAASAAFGDAFNPAEGKVEGTHSYLLRQNTKAGFLAVCYAVGVPKLASMLGLSQSRVAEMRENWQREYKVMFSRAAKGNAQEVVTLPSGREVILWDRKLVLTDGRIITSAKPSRKFLNFETQSAQADYLKACWLRLRGKWSWALAFFMHDEIALYLPEWMAAEAAADLKREMTQPIGHGVMMEADAKVAGRTWLPQPKTFDRTELESVDADA